MEYLLRLSRDALENVELQSRGDNPGQRESTELEEGAEFGFRPLPAAVADEPAQFHPREQAMPRGGFEPFRHYSFDEQKLPPGGIARRQLRRMWTLRSSSQSWMMLFRT